MNLFDLYIDYLITSLGQTTATGLSAMLDGQVSHDQVTRLLSKKGTRPSDFVGMRNYLMNTLSFTATNDNVQSLF